MLKTTTQIRNKKYSRDPAAKLPTKEITDRSLKILGTIDLYKFATTSLIKGRVPGNERITERHLQTLFHQGLINRFAFPGAFHPSEFVYFLDDRRALDLLVLKGWDRQGLDYSRVANNRDKNYAALTRDRKIEPGRLMHLQHELMISRLRFMLEKACSESFGQVRLKNFVQGSELWNNVYIKETYTDRFSNVIETGKQERIPHRPDAYFVLEFPGLEGENQVQHFFYEADRNTTTVPKFNKKLRGHYHYIIKQKLHKERYQTNSIRAVLVESITDRSAEKLRAGARDPIVAGNSPISLFWFTSSEMFENVFLDNPGVIFDSVWKTPKHPDELLSIKPNQ